MSSVNFRAVAPFVVKMAVPLPYLFELINCKGETAARWKSYEKTSEKT
jgi:hypothetical protein